MMMNLVNTNAYYQEILTKEVDQVKSKVITIMNRVEVEPKSNLKLKKRRKRKRKNK